MTATLFLDFDGVLHAVSAPAGRPVLVQRDPEGRARGLFDRANAVAEALAGLGTVVVLSTSWVTAFGLAAARNALPPALRSLVVGATADAWGSKDGLEWGRMSRWEQISLYVRTHQLEHWIALDDDDSEWPLNERHRLIATVGYVGVTDVELAELVRRLRQMGSA
jgi:HAD domain in Swiss Army Knife RNA repair proteins